MMLAAVSPTAETIGKVPWITNSMISAVIVVLILVIFVQLATRKVAMVPSGAQNFLEWLLESLYGVIESVVGKGLVKKTMPLLSAYFIFILVANWSSLLPGVGSIAWLQNVHGHEEYVPLFRGANADLNMTFALALSFMLIWFIWTVQEVGLWGFLKHNFGPKGLLETKGLSGILRLLTRVMNAFLFLIFLGVGVIELISIASRALSLPMRLYGNIYGGESLVHALMAFGPVVGTIACIPAYALELLVGLVQAMVFMLLCAVYVQLSASHEEGEEH